MSHVHRLLVPETKGEWPSKMPMPLYQCNYSRSLLLSFFHRTFITVDASVCYARLDCVTSESAESLQWWWQLGGTTLLKKRTWTAEESGVLFMVQLNQSRPFGSPLPRGRPGMLKIFPRTQQSHLLWALIQTSIILALDILKGPLCKVKNYLLLTEVSYRSESASSK